MNIPRFTAEASLYKTRALYCMNTIKLIRAEVNIYPQLGRIVATHSNPQLREICAEMGDLVNEAVQESVDSRNHPDDQQAWLDLAREMHRRATTNTGCSFGVVH